jgi:hypothetical protein
MIIQPMEHPMTTEEQRHRRNRRICYTVAYIVGLAYIVARVLQGAIR